MKINIANITEEGLNLQFFLEGRLFSELIEQEGTFAFSLDRVDVSASLRKARQSILFAGTLGTVMETQCSRCLETTHVDLQSSFNYTLLPEVPLAEVKEDAELKTEDLEVGYYAGEVLDLDPIIFEQIMLQLPMKVLCQELCKGLCPRCGINLNMESCACRSDFIDERLAVLKNFKVSH